MGQKGEQKSQSDQVDVETSSTSFACIFDQEHAQLFSSLTMINSQVSWAWYFRIDQRYPDDKTEKLFLPGIIILMRQLILI